MVPGPGWCRGTGSSGERGWETGAEPGAVAVPTGARRGEMGGVGLGMMLGSVGRFSWGFGGRWGWFWGLAPPLCCVMGFPSFASRVWGAGAPSPSAAPIAGPIFFPSPPPKINNNNNTQHPVAPAAPLARRCSIPAAACSALPSCFVN